MKEDSILIKMKNDRIEVIVARQNDYEDIKAALINKLDNLSKFFGSNNYKLFITGKNFTEGQCKEIISIVKRDYKISGVEFCTFDDLNKMDEVVIIPRKTNEEPIKKEIALDSVFMVGNLRGGQIISSMGDITIVGDVNPSSQLIAKGNICVMGALRGNAHAGAYGDKSAIIVATILEANQLRIASCIGIAPEDNKSCGCPEIAKVVGKNIEIEPINDKPKKKKRFFF